MIRSLMENDNLIDIWRLMNPDSNKFTWAKTQQNKVSWSRIDYFLLSENLVQRTLSSEINPSICSDHSMISIELDTCDTKRGPGLWKINNELLQDKDFISEVKHLVIGIKRIYHYLSKIDLWELIKFEIANFARKFSRKCSQQKKVNKFRLYDLLSSMQDEMIIDSELDPIFARNMQRVKKEIDSFETEDSKRATFRCRMRWVEGGDKCSKYFFSLEKRNYTNKTMYMVKKRDGMITKDYREILQEQKCYFEKLYEFDANVKFTLENKSGVWLSDAQKEMLDTDFSFDEMYDAMMTLHSGRCPGGDGLSIKIYRVLWNEIKVPMYEMYLELMEKGFFNPSGRRGIINLIPKKCKDELLLKSWRPIVLLGNDYKIFTKMIANRLDLIVHDIVGPQQTGFVKGRNIHTNLR